MLRATSRKAMTAAQGVAAGDQTGYPQITSQTPYPLGSLVLLKAIFFFFVQDGLRISAVEPKEVRLSS